MEPSTLYASPEPYPPIQVAGQNLTYAQLLAAPFASAQSELSTVTQYCYFSWIFAQDCPPLSQAYRGMAQIEMHHLNLLGQLISALGGNPIYRSYPYKRPVFWNSGVLQYQCHKEKALHISVAGEQSTIAGYRHLSKLIQDSCVTAILQRVILDEEVHIQLLQSYLTTT